MKKIILHTGLIMLLADWQQKNNYREGKLGKFFSEHEKPFDRDGLILHENLFMILDCLRETVKVPVIINSAYRTEEEQKALQKTNAGAVDNSPHCWGFAVDIDTKNAEESECYAGILDRICKSKKIGHRLGYKSYAKNGSSFVHLDICPAMFGVGGAWEHLPKIPKAFKISGLVW